MQLRPRRSAAASLLCLIAFAGRADERPPVAPELKPTGEAEPSRCRGFRCPIIDFLRAADWTAAKGDPRLAASEVRVLIAIMPDPLDSGAALEFDRHLEAI